MWGLLRIVLLIANAVLFAWFVLGLLTGHSYSKDKPVSGNALLEDKEHDIALAGR